MKEHGRDAVMTVTRSRKRRGGRRTSRMRRVQGMTVFQCRWRVTSVTVAQIARTFRSII